MTQLGQKVAQLSLKRRLHRRMLILRRWIQRVLDQILICPLRKPIRYRMLTNATAVTSPSLSTPEGDFVSVEHVTPICHNHGMDSDLVAVKISLLGDSQIGKTSFLVCILHFSLICMNSVPFISFFFFTKDNVYELIMHGYDFYFWH